MTLFYADDDPEEIELFCFALNEIDPGIKCLTATNGEEALEVLGNQEKPSLIFLDLNMPLCNGEEVLRELKRNSRLKSVPVIIYSSVTDEAVIKELLRIGAFRFLPKTNSLKALTSGLASIFQETLYPH